MVNFGEVLWDSNSIVSSNKEDHQITNVNVVENIMRNDEIKVIENEDSGTLAWITKNPFKDSCASATGKKFSLNIS